MIKPHYTLSVVTVTYKPNTEELALFIDSFHKYNDLGEEAHLIIVDNSPSDSWNIQDFSKKYPNVDFIPNPSNPGFGASNNLGFERYACDYVLFINNDVEFLESVFKPLISILDKDPKIGCIGIHQEGGAPSYFSKMTAPKHVKMEVFDEKVHFISGAFMFFRSCSFVKIGKFDPKLFMYFEEFDLSERLIANGLKTTFIDKYKFLHKAGHRTEQNEFAAMKGAESFCYICKKYNIDYRDKNKAYIRRMQKFLIYNLITFNIKEVLKLRRIIAYRLSTINKNFK